MAVVQISKIQIRSDVKDAAPDSDLPIRLSNAEFAWCIDTKQLYIGSSLVNNATQLENIEILTKNSDIFSLGRYTYKQNGYFRTISKRLEDRVSANDFGILEGDILSNASINTNIFKDIIQKLYTNAGRDSRAIIEFGPGIYLFDGTIKLPSFTHIEGSGKGNTIFKFISPGTMFESVHSDTNPIELINQCKYIKVRNVTIEIVRPTVITSPWSNAQSVIFDLYGVTQCEFEDVELIGPLVSGSVTPDAINSIAIKMDEARPGTQYTLSPFTFSNLNTFKNVFFKNFKTAILATQPINKNLITDCKFTNSRLGIEFGSTNNNVGPTQNTIRSCFFEYIQRQAIKVFKGTANLCANNVFLNVGNNFGGVQNATFGQVEFDVPGNLNLDYSSTRHIDLSGYGTNSYSTRPYVSEFTGYGLNTNNITFVKQIEYSLDEVELMRFPLPVSNTSGIGPDSMSVEVDYLYQSSSFDPNGNDRQLFERSRRLRKGTFTVIVDFRTNLQSTAFINFYDDYEYVGYGITINPTANQSDEDINLIFQAKEQIFTKQNHREIIITYKHLALNINQVPFETGKLTYTYRVLT